MFLDSILELIGHHGGDIRGLTLTFQKPDADAMSVNTDATGTTDTSEDDLLAELGIESHARMFRPRRIMRGQHEHDETENEHAPQSVAAGRENEH